MRLDPHERWVRANAEYFTACAFRGRGCYERVECRNIEEARRQARRLSADRGAMIYAVYPRHQALVETVDPVPPPELRSVGGFYRGGAALARGKLVCVLLRCIGLVRNGHCTRLFAISLYAIRRR
jgi:hypothetical protein